MLANISLLAQNVRDSSIRTLLLAANSLSQAVLSESVLRKNDCALFQEQGPILLSFSVSQDIPSQVLFSFLVDQITCNPSEQMVEESVSTSLVYLNSLLQGYLKHSCPPEVMPEGLHLLKYMAGQKKTSRSITNLF